MAVVDRSAQSVVLSDGRELAFAEWGDPASDFVVVDFHGCPGSRLNVNADPDVLAGLRVRWITFDRPSIGKSWPAPGRRVVDTATDVGQLADALGVERFAVVGWSMGAPYAAASAVTLPERVSALGLLAPVPVGFGEPAVFERLSQAPFYALAHDDPWQLAQLFTSLALELRRNPEVAIQGLSAAQSDAEHAELADRRARDRFVEFLVEATRQGAVGIVDDVRVCLDEWGFDPTAYWRRPCSGKVTKTR